MNFIHPRTAATVEMFDSSSDLNPSDERVQSKVLKLCILLGMRDEVRGQTKCSSKDFYDADKQGFEYPAQRDTATPSLSQAWGRGQEASVWWLGLCPWSPVHGKVDMGPSSCG